VISLKLYELGIKYSTLLERCQHKPSLAVIPGACCITGGAVDYWL